MPDVKTHIVAGLSFYLPTTYTIVALFAVLSGVHYIFHVAKLMKEEPDKKPEH